MRERATIRPDDAHVVEQYPLKPSAGHIPRASVEMPIAPPPEGETPWIGPNGQVMERLELHLTYHCPERCVFCSEEHRMEAYQGYDVSWGRVATVLRTHASRGVKSVHLTGGEPTIHPQFIEVCALARKLGMRTSIGTIGTMLAREDFARRAVPLLDEALFSLHGPNADINDRMTRRKGSFDQTVRAIRNTLAVNPDFRLFVNTVVTKHNVDALPDTVALADELGAQLIVVSNTTPEGGGFDKYRELGVPLAKLAEVMPRVPARAQRAIIRFFGMPMCLLEPHAMLSNDLHWDPRVTVEWGTRERASVDAPGKVAFDGVYTWTPDRKRRRVDACERCARNTVCMGVYDRYAELYDTGELRPYTSAMAGAPEHD